MGPVPRSGRAPSVRALVLVAAAAGLMACSGASRPGTFPPGDPTPPDRLASAVRPDDADTHLRALQGIADRFGGNRSLGTPGYDASVDYVVGRLRAAGYAVEIPEFTARTEDGDRVTTAVDLHGLPPRADREG